MDTDTIVVVSSTLFPAANMIPAAGSCVAQPLQRLEQTRQTVASLVELGYKQIYIADNSGANWAEGTDSLLGPATVMRFDPWRSNNKGISELRLLKDALGQLPKHAPIVKLSGRYTLRHRLQDCLGSADFVFRRYGRAREEPDGRRTGMRYPHVSTIAYAARSGSFLSELLASSLRELFAYPWRVVGPGSLGRVLRRTFAPHFDAYPYDDPPISIELAFERAIRQSRYRVNYISELGVSGITSQNGLIYAE